MCTTDKLSSLLTQQRHGVAPPGRYLHRRRRQAQLLRRPGVPLLQPETQLPALAAAPSVEAAIASQCK